MVLVFAGVLTACTVGPSTRPPLATSGARGPVAGPQSSTSAPPTGPGGPGRTSDPISWGPCPDGIDATDPATRRSFTLQCAQVGVPKLYTDSGSGSLSVAVVRARSTGTPVNAPPLVVAMGEPGQHGTHQVAAVAAGLPAEILAHFAIVIVDVRGTDDSVPLNCVSTRSSAALLAPGADPTTPVAAGRLADLSRTLTFDCGDVVGPDLSDYSTQVAADDLDTIRAALGVGRLDFVGRGFGATLGAVYADRYPGRVRAVVLDGPDDPSSTAAQQAAAAAAAYQAALVSFAAACQTFTGGCPLGAAPAATVAALVAALGDTGVTGGSQQQITGGSVLGVLTGQLGDPATWPRLATTLASAVKGDTVGIEQLLRAAAGSQDVEQQQSGRLVYRCNDHPQRLGGAALAAAVAGERSAAPMFGPYLLGQVGLCSSWPAPQAALGGVTAAGAPPILVVGAVDDPVSPFSEVRSLSAELDSATLLTWESGTNGAYPASTCVKAAVDGYLLTGRMPPSNTVCPP